MRLGSVFAPALLGLAIGDGTLCDRWAFAETPSHVLISDTTIESQPVERSRAVPPPPAAPGADDARTADGVDRAAPIDLRSALQLAGVQNLDLLIAQQRVEAAIAAQQFAAAQLLPSLNAGTNYDRHTGVLQQASGNILTVHRNALYVGAGANAVAAGSVSIPGIQYNLNISQTIYNYLVSRQLTGVSRFDRQAADDAILLEVAVAYLGLLRAEGTRSIAILTRNDARRVASLTAAYAKTGEGRPADAERAATELARREQDVAQSESGFAEASHRLSELLNLDGAVRLRAAETNVVPRSIVPTQIPLPQLLAIGALERPDLKSRRTAIEAALLELDAAKVLPFSPQLICGFSGGAFGGGSDLVASSRMPRFGAPIDGPRFGNFDERTDLDVVLYWSLRNLGVGNKAMIDATRSRLRGTQLEELVVLDRARQEIADAFVRVHARFREIDRRARGVESGTNAFKEDMIRVKAREGLPIELLDSLRQLSLSRQNYLDAIVSFNRAELELYVALGSPPADTLARAVPEDVVRPDAAVSQ